MRTERVRTVGGISKQHGEPRLHPAGKCEQENGDQTGRRVSQNFGSLNATDDCRCGELLRCGWLGDLCGLGGWLL